MTRRGFWATRSACSSILSTTRIPLRTFPVHARAPSAACACVYLAPRASHSSTLAAPPVCNTYSARQTPTCQDAGLHTAVTRGSGPQWCAMHVLCVRCVRCVRCFLQLLAALRTRCGTWLQQATWHTLQQAACHRQPGTRCNKQPATGNLAHVATSSLPHVATSNLPLCATLACTSRSSCHDASVLTDVHCGCAS